MGTFIQVSVNPNQLSPSLSQQLVRLCPVDIFELKDGQLVINGNQEDECTLCRQCLDATPQGTVVILKRYSGERLTASG